MSAAQYTEESWSDMIDDMKKDHEKGVGERKYWSPPSKEEGTFPIRILPPLKGERKFYFSHRIHWVDSRAYECIDQTLVNSAGELHEAEECPICKFVKKLYRTAERKTDEWNLAGELSAKNRYVYRIVVRGKEDETQPEFYETGKKIFDILYHILTETDFGIIVDPKNGRDFNITKAGTGRRSNYDQSLPAPNPTPIFKEVPKLKLVFENATKMQWNSLVNFNSYDDLKRALNEHLGVEEIVSVKKESIEKEFDGVDDYVSSDSNNDEKIVDDEEDDIDAILKQFSS